MPREKDEVAAYENTIRHYSNVADTTNMMCGPQEMSSSQFKEGDEQLSGSERQGQ